MIRGYIASSADGYVADRNGDVDWLTPFQDVDSGYEQFITEIDVVVMGRVTYQQILTFGSNWPYPGKRGFVVTSSDLDVAAEGTEVWKDGVSGLAKHLKSQDLESWIVGGPQLQTAFIKAGLLDRLELFIIPVLLGEGVPLYHSDGGLKNMELNFAKTLDKGMVKLDYRFVE